MPILKNEKIVVSILIFMLYTKVHVWKCHCTQKKLLCDLQTCFHSKVNGKTEVCEHTGEFFFDDLGEDAVIVTKDDESNRLKNFVELKRCVAHDSVKNRPSSSRH